MRRSGLWLFPASLPIVLVALAALVWALTPGEDARGDFPTGKITVSSTAITGQEGKTLVVSAVPAGGGAGLARICAAITSDPFTLPPTVMTDPPAEPNPCGPPTPETVFVQGSYTITAGVYVGGSQTPDAETQMAAEITAGDISVDLDGAELSVEPFPFGDVDCDGDVDAVDALKIMRHVAALPVSQNEPCPNIGP